MKTKLERLKEKRDKISYKILVEEKRIGTMRDGTLFNKNRNKKVVDIEIRSMLDVSKITRICVSQGDYVKRGDEILVVEHLKMEIPVLSPEDGRVISLYAFLNDEVKKDDLLAIISS